MNISPKTVLAIGGFTFLSILGTMLSTAPLLAASDSVGGSRAASEKADVRLENGVPVTGVRADQGEQLRFTLQVPIGARDLEFTTAGGSGDADLYVRLGAPPSLSDNDCGSASGNNSESCSFAAPGAGTWHVLVHGFDAFANLRLTASFSAGDGLCNGREVPGLGAGQGGELRFFLEVPGGFGLRHLEFLLTGGSGDADLFVRRGTPPTRTEYDCASQASQGVNEVCSFSSPSPGTWYVLVYGFLDFSGARLTGSFSRGDCLPGPGRLCLERERFQVEVEWRDFLGSEGYAQAVELDDDGPGLVEGSGLLYFFNRNNWEMLIKVLDACGFNDHFWVFAAATTDVQYTLRITDTETGVVRTYFNRLGNAAPALTDTFAFPTCP